MVSNYQTIMVSSSMANLYSTLSWNKRLAHGLNIITNEHSIMQALHQTYNYQSFGSTKRYHGRKLTSRENVMLFCGLQESL